MKRILAACALVCACGCFPAITHGARVEDGWVAGVMAGTTDGDTHVEGDEGGIHLRQALIGPYVGYGSASSRRSMPGFYIGAAVPVFFPLAQVDAYLQLPPAVTGPLSAGFGGTASGEGVHGYAMFGADLDRKTSWYVSGGYGERQSSSTFQGGSPAWFGNAGIIMASGYLRTQLFVQYADGLIPAPCEGCKATERAHALSLGIALGRHQNNINRRAARP
jgi:hypothetical protein